jgi:hypothetical protein
MPKPSLALARLVAPGDSYDPAQPKPVILEPTVMVYSLRGGGYLVLTADSQEAIEERESEDGPEDACQRMLNAVKEAVGMVGSKHSAFRCVVHVIDQRSGEGN